ncbi:MAG: hypothetical protein V1917_03595 [Candidatus Gottesmanbacteria bacterium]
MDQQEETLGTAIVKHQEKVVYIFNMSEDVWAFINAISNPKFHQWEIDDNADLSDRGELFTNADEEGLMYISPKKIDEMYVSYVKELFSIKSLEILVPEIHTGVICDDILRDEKIMDRLVEASNSVKKLTLTSYSTSPQFLHLAETLRSKGITVYTPESPEINCAWTVNFYGSKSGIRQLVQMSGAKEPDLKMPEGVVCAGIIDAAKIAANKYIKENGVVIKTNKGHSGSGVLIFREHDLPNEYSACEKAIHAILGKDAYWEQFPIVIESLININPAIAGGFPNVEFKIQKNGKIEFLYFCGMRVTKDGVFQGIEINQDIVTDRVFARIMDTGFFVAEQYSAAGYRGYFDVDFIAAKNGEIYVTESNTRRTGGTHAYKAGKLLIGKEFLKEAYILSDNALTLPERMSTFTHVHQKLKPILFDKKTKEGVVIASSNLIRQHRLAYVIFGSNEKRALEIEEQMKQLLA